MFLFGSGCLKDKKDLVLDDKVLYGHITKIHDR